MPKAPRIATRIPAPGNNRGLSRNSSKKLACAGVSAATTFTFGLAAADAGAFSAAAATGVLAACSAGVFLTLFIASIWNFSQLVTVGIFPILILMLLSETFIDIQAGRSGSEARALIFQTFILAMISSLLLGNEMIQRAVLLFPEIIFFGVALFDIFMGRYTGLRLSEYLMYRGIVKEDEEE